MPFIFIALTAALSLLLYARYVEPRWVVHTERHVPLPLKKPLTIVLIADLHAKRAKGARFFRGIVRRVNRLEPDLVLLAGDFLDKVHTSLHALDPLRDLWANFGVYAVLGNHDIGDIGRKLADSAPLSEHTHALITKLKDFGFVVLENEHRIVDIGDEQLAIAGIGDLWARRDDIGKALAGIPASAPVILLSHNPDIILDPRSRRAALVASGHTHGGQLRLPWWGPLRGVASEIGNAFGHGIFRFDDTLLAVTRGLGEALMNVRFFARPEIMVMRTEKK